jgi:hypothetical protein
MPGDKNPPYAGDGVVLPGVGLCGLCTAPAGPAGLRLHYYKSVTISTDQPSKHACSHSGIFSATRANKRAPLSQEGSAWHNSAHLKIGFPSRPPPTASNRIAAALLAPTLQKYWNCCVLRNQHSAMPKYCKVDPSIHLIRTRSRARGEGQILIVGWRGK